MPNDRVQPIHATQDVQVYNNSVFSKTGEVRVCNGPVSSSPNLSIPLDIWVSRGHDQGSTAGVWPTAKQLEQWATDLLTYQHE